VLIVDHDIGGFQGCEVATRLKDIAKAPVILLAGSPELREKPACADLLLPKPVSPEVLLAQIAILLSAHPELPACD
jgi:DNA-binding response OmpR family regulator